MIMLMMIRYSLFAPFWLSFRLIFSMMRYRWGHLPAMATAGILDEAAANEVFDFASINFRF